MLACCTLDPFHSRYLMCPSRVAVIRYAVLLYIIYSSSYCFKSPSHDPTSYQTCSKLFLKHLHPSNRHRHLWNTCSPFPRMSWSPLGRTESRSLERCELPVTPAHVQRCDTLSALTHISYTDPLLRSNVTKLGPCVTAVAIWVSAVTIRHP